MDYLKRVFDTELDLLKPLRGGILIEGAKGVGKTTTASRRAKSIYKFKEEQSRRIAEENLDSVLNDNFPVLLDEWHLLPNLWNDAITQIDNKGLNNCAYIFTGSSPARFQNLHSGAARIIRLKMRPMTLSERGVVKPRVSFSDLMNGNFPKKSLSTDFLEKDYIDEIVSSGFPSIRNQSAHGRTIALNSYLDLIATHDLMELGFRIRQPQLIKSWIKAYASATGTTASWAKIRDIATSKMDTAVSRRATQPYIELLGQLSILDELPAWTGSKNFKTDLAKMEKHYLADPALAARSLNLNEKTLADPANRPFLGSLFEALAVLTIKVYAQALSASVFHMRTSDSRHEVDMIVEGADGSITAIEVKLSSKVDDGDLRNLLWLKENSRQDIDNLILIYAGKRTYIGKHGILILPLAELGL